MIKRITGAALALLLFASPAWATDFLYDPGTNGFTATPFSLQTTELNTLGNGNTVISSVNGGSSNGTFTQTDTANALWCVVTFLSGGSFTPSGTAPQITGWWVRKSDNSHFEKLVTNTAMPRAPDFIIPLYAGAYAANDISASQGGLVRLPAETFEVLIQNNSGVSLPASANKVICGPEAIKY